ncbi:hypothetical protein D1Y84_14580 [Acidipila sp. EB88]|nr:hypothetical protein D1Y84_14580 [Acidipila sp. EB88]
MLQLGRRTLFVLVLEPSNGQAGPITGSMSRPAHFTTADAVSFSDVQGPTEVDRIVASRWEGNVLSFTTQNPKDASDKTIYRLTPKDKDDVQLRIEGVPLPPLTFVRPQGDATVSQDWHSGQRYSPDDDAPSNPAMKKIFDEDQRVRLSYPNIDWPSVNKSDAIRRTETMKLLTDGALHSGEDFTWAAHIFQHGSGPDDFLLAHTLAIVAVRKGYSDATWIASATLDRYLQSIKQPQIYGTQFITPDGKPTAQDPYNRVLIPDALRRQLEVPDLAAQQTQRQQYDTQRHIGSKDEKP